MVVAPCIKIPSYYSLNLMLVDFTLHPFVPRFLRVIKSLSVEPHQTTKLLQSGKLRSDAPRGPTTSLLPGMC
jgi:hypothetical protein